MEGDLHDIDDLFRKAIGDHKEAPSAGVWEKLDKSLDKSKVVSISRKYRKLKWVAAALFIFSSSVAMYTWHVNSRIKAVIRQNENYVNGSGKKAALRGSTSRVEKSAMPGSTREDTKNAVPLSENEASAADTTFQNRTAIASAAAIDSAKEKAVDSSVVSKHDANGSGNRQAAGNLQPSSPVSHLPVITRRNDIKPDQSKSSPANSRGNQVVQNERRQADKLHTSRSHSRKHDSMDLPAQSDATKEDADVLKNSLAGITAEGKDIRVSGETLAVHRTAIEPSIFQNNFLGAPSFLRTALPQATASGEKSVIKLKPAKKPLFTLSPYFSFDKVSSTVGDNDHRFREDERNQIKDKERIEHSHSMGVSLAYHLNDNWSLETGINFSTMTTSIQPKLIFARPDNMGNINYRFNCSAGYSFVTLKSGGNPAPGDSIQALSSKNTLAYIGVPLTLRYELNAGKFTFEPGLGLMANFLIRGKIQTEIAGRGGIEKLATDHIEGLNSMYMNGSLSLGVNYSINKTVGLTVTPGMRFGLSSINKDAPVKTFLHAFGLGAGLAINL